MKKFNFTIKPSIAWSGDEQEVQFAQNFAGRTSFSPELLSQHCGITGQTGAGKTDSYALPFCVATLNYRNSDGKLAGGLVIDPKSELYNKLQATASIGNRLVKIGGDRKRLRYFEFTSDSSSPWERTKRVFKLVADEPSSPRDIDHWCDMGITLACDIMQIQAAVLQKSLANGQAPLDLLADAITRHRDFVYSRSDKWQDLVESDAPKFHSKGDIASSLDRFAVAGKSNLRLLRDYLEIITSSHAVLKYAWSHMNQLLEQYALDLPNPLSCFTSSEELIKQFMYLQMSIQPYLAKLSSPELEPLIDLDPTRLSDVEKGGLSMRKCLDAGGIIVYQPGTLEPEIDHLVGKVIKELFVRHIQSRDDMKQPIVYVCDEFHRYVSADRNYGEPVFLSFCRGYRVMACLCTQSVSALDFALSGRNGSTNPEAARDSILANIGTKIMMRSTDANSQATAQSIYPFAACGDRPHILAVRPLSTLKVGESYFMTADARFGREKVILPVKNGLQIDLQPEPASERKSHPSKSPELR